MICLQNPCAIYAAQLALISLHLSWTSKLKTYQVPCPPSPPVPRHRTRSESPGKKGKDGAETPCNGQITNTPEKSCCKSKMNSRKVSCKNAHDAGTYPRPKTNFWCGGTKQLLLTGTTGLHLSCAFLYHALQASASHLWAFNWMDQSQSLASAMV